MVSIWEGNQCKKAQLTLMEISTTIKNKVVRFSYCRAFVDLQSSFVGAWASDLPAKQQGKVKRWEGLFWLRVLLVHSLI